MEDILWYSQPATVFGEALPVGNGKLGAMVYGGTGKEKLSLNLDTLWSGKPVRYSKPDAPATFAKARQLVWQGKPGEAEELLENHFHSPWTASYLPLGNLYLTMTDPKVTGYRRELNLAEAVATTLFGDVTRRVFASFPDNCIVLQVTAAAPRCFTLQMDSPLEYEIEAGADRLILTGHCPVVGRRTNAQCDSYIYEDDGIRFTAVAAVHTNGSVSAAEKTLTVTAATRLTVIFSAASSYIDYKTAPVAPHRDPCLNTVDAALQKGATALLTRHLEDYRALYGRVSVKLPVAESSLPTDERIASPIKDAGLTLLLFNYGRFLTIESSRPGSQASNLQGIWNEDLFPAWNSNYTVNINTEMNYWPTLACTLPECTKPLEDLILRLVNTGRDTAAHYYGADGFTCHHNTDPWGLSTPLGNVGYRFSCGFADWPFGSAWLCAHLFWYYEYTLDTDWLRTVCYPTLKEAAKFYLSAMVEKDGEWIFSPATSPENSYQDAEGNPHQLDISTTMSQTLVKELYTNCICCCELLHTDKEFADILRGRLEKIHPFHIGNDGRLMEWNTEHPDVEVTHRHLSHLYGLYPGELITRDMPDLRQAVRRSLEVRGDAGTGWSLAWKANLWARLGDGNRVQKLVHDQLNPVTCTEMTIAVHGGSYPNLLCAHPPFQIDGNFGITAAVAQMLLQSVEDRILLLPALPEEYTAGGSVAGLAAKGNVTVSFAWKDGIITDVRVKSPVLQTVKVEYNGQLHLLKTELTDIAEIFTAK